MDYIVQMNPLIQETDSLDTISKKIRSVSNETRSVLSQTRSSISEKIASSLQKNAVCTSIDNCADDFIRLAKALDQTMRMYKDNEQKLFHAENAQRSSGERLDSIRARRSITMTNSFLAGFLTHKKHGSYSVDSIVFDEKGRFGRFWGNPAAISGTERKELYALVRKYYPHASDRQIADYLRQLNRKGFGYAGVFFALFHVFSGREKDFERTFGFPMFDKNGDRNYNRLMTDFFCVTDRRRKHPFHDPAENPDPADCDPSPTVEYVPEEAPSLPTAGDEVDMPEIPSASEVDPDSPVLPPASDSDPAMPNDHSETGEDVTPEDIAERTSEYLEEKAENVVTPDASGSTSDAQNTASNTGSSKEQQKAIDSLGTYKGSDLYAAQIASLLCF